MHVYVLQVAASTQKEIDAQIPAYPNLPPQLICQLHDVILHVSLCILSHDVILHVKNMAFQLNTLNYMLWNFHVGSILFHYVLSSFLCLSFCSDRLTWKRMKSIAK